MARDGGWELQTPPSAAAVPVQVVRLVRPVVHTYTCIHAYIPRYLVFSR